jgi:hypothetical protein
VRHAAKKITTPIRSFLVRMTTITTGTRKILVTVSQVGRFSANPVEGMGSSG